VRCIENGYYQRELADAAYRYQQQIEERERIIVGVNAFRSADEQKIPIFKNDPDTERRQIQRTKELRATRDASRVTRALADLADAARAGANTIPPLIGAVRAYATVGEICDALRGVYGTYRPNVIV
jgi:methylmalonyl-CoA mutase N-terminal domain/subunit